MIPYAILGIALAYLIGRMINAGNRTGFVDSTSLMRLWRRL